MSQWIWNFGDFEIYHSLLLHDRRIGYGRPIPAMWKLYSPEPNVRFEKLVNTQGGTFRVLAKGRGEVIVYENAERYSLKNKKYGFGETIPLPAGEKRILIEVSNPVTFPCVYIDGVIESDASWTCDDVTGNFLPVGTWEVFDAPDKNPEVFPFATEPVSYETREAVEGGFLYDFGKELFCRLSFSGLKGPAKLRLGESREEAMSPEYCVIQYDLTPEDGCATILPSGFRWLYLSDGDAEIHAEYEYLPMPRRGAFACGDPLVDWVWDTAAYTLHLNCREFFLDGIKRDRWVWSADAYQTQFVHHTLFLDPDIEKRTLIALGGKRPFVQHVNTIVDYTFFWIMGLWEYYKTYGDKTFLAQMLPQVEEVVGFIQRNRDEDGLYRGKAHDWVFIDWNDFIDKTGAVCGEEILMAKAFEDYASILETLGRDGSHWMQEAETLRSQIRQLFWDEALGAFIDSYESGRKNVSRHCNLWAYLYLPLTEAQKASIYRNVVCNDAVPPITTPYFKFYENMVHCEAGDPEHRLEDCIRNYYGPMKALGATTLFEEFDPTKQGVEHYAMYNRPFDKSLCHAWSSSPIYLLATYRLGVKNTGVAFDSFEVKPMRGGLPPFSGTVPLPHGEVRVEVGEECVRVTATVPGGTLIVGERRMALEPNVPAEVPLEA